LKYYLPNLLFSSILYIYFILNLTDNVFAERFKLTQFKCSPSTNIVLKSKLPISTETIIKFYTIRGNTIQQLKQQLKVKGLPDNYGIKRSANVLWRIMWRWKLIEKNIPDLNKAKIEFNCSIILPCYRIGNRSLKKSWRKYFSDLVKHEKNHLSNAYNAHLMIKNQINKFKLTKEKLTSNEINYKLHKIIILFNNKDIDYDKQTKHGKTEGIEL
jgi:predicted secreted Zn-dependent protease